MKRYVTILLLVCIITVLFVGCGENQAQSSTLPTAVSQSTITHTTNICDDALYMPEKLIIRDSYSASNTKTFSAVDEDTMLIISGEDKGETVDLTKEQIRELNTLFSSVTDVSNLPEVEGRGNVTMYFAGHEYWFYSAMTTDPKLEEYCNLLYQYALSCATRNVSLVMPDKIDVQDGCADTSQHFLIEHKYNAVLRITKGNGKIREYTLNDDEIKELNEKFASVTDFRSIDGLVGGNTAIYMNGVCYEYYRGQARQPQLDEYVDLLISYYWNGTRVKE